jgi:hypothetical protein
MQILIESFAADSKLAGESGLLLASGDAAAGLGSFIVAQGLAAPPIGSTLLGQGDALPLALLESVPPIEPVV